jgi:hypothetical protein
MATCNLCHRDLPDEEIDDHRRTTHPDIAADGTRKSDSSRIVPETPESAPLPE